MPPWRQPLRLGLLRPVATGHAERMSLSRNEEHASCVSHARIGARISFGFDSGTGSWIDPPQRPKKAEYLRGSMVLGFRSDFDIVASNGASERGFVLLCAMYNASTLTMSPCEDCLRVAAVECVAGVCCLEHGSYRCIHLFQYGQEGSRTAVTSTNHSDTSGLIGATTMESVAARQRTLQRKTTRWFVCGSAAIHIHLLCSATGLDPRSLECTVGKNRWNIGPSRVALFPPPHSSPFASGGLPPRPFGWTVVSCRDDVSGVAGWGVADYARFRKGPDHCYRNGRVREHSEDDCVCSSLFRPRPLRSSPHSLF